MTLDVFVKILRERFYAEIALKTGWGKEELKVVFERAVSDAIASLYVGKQ